MKMKITTEEEAWKFLLDDAEKLNSGQPSNDLIRICWSIAGICSVINNLYHGGIIDYPLKISLSRTIECLPSHLFERRDSCLYLGGKPGREGLDLRIKIMKKLANGEPPDSIEI